MGSFSVEVTLKNAGDVAMARNGFIGEKDVRQETVRAVVDTGASTMVITEELCGKLGLALKEDRFITIADGSRKPCKRTEAVEIHWNNRSTDCQALVVPGAERNLLGAIPIEGMDLLVDPVHQRLEGAHGDLIIDMAL